MQVELSVLRLYIVKNYFYTFFRVRKETNSELSSRIAF